MTTATKIGEPARSGEWGLTFDSMERPTDVVVIRYERPAKRHTEPFSITHRLPYNSDADALITTLVDTAGMPRKTASQLVVQLAAKAASPKVAAADMVRRPVC